ncbi:MAG: hypothetical protein AAFU85_04980 [Planctomycetota bacterium]
MIRFEWPRRIGVSLLASAALCGGVLADGPFGFRPRPKTEVERLAQKIDTLEKHIDRHGSVVAKMPDVFGESRLTRHRREFEEVIEKELETFDVTLNATVRRSDQAFLANAFSLSASLSEGTPAPMSNPAVSVFTQSLGVTAADGTAPSATAAPINRTALLGGPLAGTSSNFVGFENNGVAIEPVVKLDQLKRYLDHLNEIRRINEGDDTGDSPGYTINLVRIPVSVLPGTETRQGYGAEITITARPHLSRETLPRAFRNWVINDLVDELTLPTLKRVDVESWKASSSLYSYLYDLLTDPAYPPSNPGKGFPPNFDVVYDRFLDTQLLPFFELDKELVKSRGVKGSSRSESFKKALDKVILDNEKAKLSLLSDQERISAKRLFLLVSIRETIEKRSQGYSNPSRARRSRYSVPTSTRALVYARSFQRRGIKGSPSPCLFEVDRLEELAKRMNVILDLRRDAIGRIPNTEARSFIREELKGAYDFLVESGKQNPEIWHLADDLYEIIREGRDEQLLEKQKAFARLIGNGGLGRSVRTQPYDYQVTEDLAWCILVESALLNRAIVDDIKRTAEEKNSPCLIAPDCDQFYLPIDMLPEETTHAFNAYVNCRWPIKAFALDPVVQEQNVADVFSLRRELQLAASVALASGEMSLGNFSQFARRIELDTETVALNRTVIGFAHGDDTFGWRYQPRVQTGEIDGTFKSFAQTLLGGPKRDRLIRDHRLEPGMRECTAILVTPSFVPYVTFDTRTNWYRLTRPSRKEFDLLEGTRWGREVTDLRRLKNACMADQNLHRDGQVYRLMRAVDQLEERLPLQTMFVQMPVEDSKGGFQTIAVGTQNLGPELVGFYGQPGYDTTKESSFYLVGDNFSIHDTRVIAGGVALRTYDETATAATPATPAAATPAPAATTPAAPAASTGATTTSMAAATPAASSTAASMTKQVRMLSRQILEVRLPAGLKPYTRKFDGTNDTQVIAVQVGTPYGVSGVLEIPVIKEESAATAAAAAATTAAQQAIDARHPVVYQWEKVPTGSATLVFDANGVSQVNIEDAIDKVKLQLNTDKLAKDAHDRLIPVPARTGLLVFEMTITSGTAGKTPITKKVSGPWPVILNNDFDLNLLEAQLQVDLRNAIPVDFNPSEITLRGLVRFNDDTGAGIHRDRPIHRLGNDLKLKVVVGKQCEGLCVPALTDVSHDNDVMQRLLRDGAQELEHEVATLGTAVLGKK